MKKRKTEWRYQILHNGGFHAGYTTTKKSAIAFVKSIYPGGEYREIGKASKKDGTK